MSNERTILHCDLNNFYASVECVQNPILWTKPVAVTGNPRTRHGIILAKNNVAKTFGVKTTQTIWEARKLCPNLICLPCQFDLYQDYSQRVREIYKRFTDQVESFGPDECWLDVTHSLKLFGSGTDIANKLRNIVHQETGLTISVGVSFNKFFAKLGSDMKKPDATTVISRENYKQKIYPLPANSLIFIGAKSFDKLNKLNIFTIGDLAQADPQLLYNTFGVIGTQFSQIARGEDNTPVEHQDSLISAKSVGNGMTTIRNLTTREEIEALIYNRAEKVAFRMRQSGYQGKTAHLSIKDSNLHSVSHSLSSHTPIDNAEDIAKLCIKIFNSFWKGETFSVRALRVSMCNFTKDTSIQQVNFFTSPNIQKLHNLDKSLDQIRNKYGYNAIQRAKTLNRDFINYFEIAEENDEE